MEELINNMELYLKASIFMSFIAAFAGGVLASFTPCVYPMIPITVSLVGSRNLGGSRAKGFLLSLLYVAGVAVTYAAMGVFAAMTGRLFGEINTNPWAFIIVANIIIFLGLGMLDVFYLPTFSPKFSPKLGGFAGIFLGGIISGFVAGPCTAPVLGVLLAFVASTQNMILGGSLLFVFAFGMGIILMLVGTFSGVMASMPKSGEWMVKVKKILGYFMIGLGEYFLIKAGQLII
ncbi:MAG: hypothetical protein B6I30_06155 [Desulfobacteraceae bacterium 4572_187]|nr:MAG: hypothetical protein B6I30_06155 [Desulfobacteraceae bacterium 4572_187]